MPSRFSQRWTVLTSRLRKAAISFQESRRSAASRDTLGGAGSSFTKSSSGWAGTEF
jgi:hypothetical protein